MRKKWIWVASACTLIIVGIITYFAYSIIDFGSDINKKPEDSRFREIYERQPIEPVNEPPKWEGTERVNILLIGGDSRGLGEHEIPRSDSLMLVSIDPKTKTARLYSILRDTYVKIPGHGHDRINAALTYGGPELSMKVVSDLMDLPVQYFIYADFEGFIKLVDAIGGVEFYVEKDMKYTDPTDKPEYNIDLKKGLQHMDGNKALQYVRFRYDALSDFTRTERQREFLKAVAAKMQKTTTLLKLPNILDEIEPYIETNLTLNQMWRLGTLGFSIDTSIVEGVQIPPSGLVREERLPNGAEVLTADWDKLKQFVADDLAKSVAPPEPEEPEEPDQKSPELSGTGGHDRL